MKKYYFFFNNSNKFSCEFTEDNKQVEFTEQKAVNELLNIDKMKFNKLRASNRLINLNGEDISVIISNLNDFYSYGYSKYIPSIMERVNKAIAKKQKAKHRDEKIRNMKITGSRIACGALILAILGTTENALNKRLSDNNSNDFTIENEYNYMSNNTKQIQTDINENEYNQMINELDEAVEHSNEVLPSNNTIEKSPISTAYLRYDDLTSTETYMGAYDNYYSIVEKYSTKWGISPNVIMAMLTQESAGKQTNLMQIQFNSWTDQVLTEYDFENERYQSIVLTDKPNRYAGQNITVITRDDLQNKITNISVACVILRYCLNQMDYNILASIQAYNLGCPNMQIVLNETSRNTGQSVDNLLSDQTNVEFQNYTHVVECGDPKYVSNVCRYLTDGEITVQRINDEGKVETLEIAIVQKQL